MQSPSPIENRSNHYEKITTVEHGFRLHDLDLLVILSFWIRYYCNVCLTLCMTRGYKTRQTVVLVCTFLYSSLSLIQLVVLVEEQCVARMSVNVSWRWFTHIFNRFMSAVKAAFWVTFFRFITPTLFLCTVKYLLLTILFGTSLGVLVFCTSTSPTTCIDFFCFAHIWVDLFPCKLSRLIHTSLVFWFRLAKA